MKTIKEIVGVLVLSLFLTIYVNLIDSVYIDSLWSKNVYWFLGFSVNVYVVLLMLNNQAAKFTDQISALSQENKLLKVNLWQHTHSTFASHASAWVRENPELSIVVCAFSSGRNVTFSDTGTMGSFIKQNLPKSLCIDPINGYHYTTLAVSEELCITINGQSANYKISPGQVVLLYKANEDNLFVLPHGVHGEDRLFDITADGEHLHVRKIVLYRQ